MRSDPATIVTEGYLERTVVELARILKRTVSVKTLAQLQQECAAAGLIVPTNGREKKDDYIVALREHHWRKDHPSEPLPPQIMPMLLGNWEDLDDTEAEQIEQEGSGWLVQPKLDGVRCLLHVEGDRVRLTTRCISEVTYRLSELQDNVPHLTVGWSQLDGTILDGELVCPLAQIDTGKSVTAHALQAAVAVISTSPDNARLIQERHDAHLRLHVFDILRYRGDDVTALPLLERIELVHRAVTMAGNPHLEIVASNVIGKRAIHDQLIAGGAEGSVWKKSDERYEPGKRVKFWLKRKRGIVIEAYVSGFKAGNNGHAGVVGAVEFSVQQPDGTSRPIGWVTGWTDAERKAMTQHDDAGNMQLNLAFLGRRALITGEGHSAKAKRLRHARIVRWRER